MIRNLCKSAVSFQDTDGDLILLKLNPTTQRVDMYANDKLELSSITILTCSGPKVAFTGTSSDKKEKTMKAFASASSIAQNAVKSFELYVNEICYGRSADHIRLSRFIHNATGNSYDRFVSANDRHLFAKPSSSGETKTPTPTTLTTHPLCHAPIQTNGEPIDKPFLPSEHRAVSIEFINWFANKLDLGYMRAASWTRAQVATKAAKGVVASDKDFTKLQDNAVRQNKYAQAYEELPFKISIVNLCYDFIVPETKVHNECRYCELPSIRKHVNYSKWFGETDYFVSHCWSGDFHVMLECLNKHSNEIKSKTGRSPFYWIDIFAVCQHRGDKKLEDLGKLQSNVGANRNQGLPGVISRTKEKTTLVLMSDWDLMLPLTRTWCLYEIWMSKKHNLEIKILFKADLGLLSLIPLLKQHRFHTKMDTIDLNRAATGRVEDQTYIMNSINKSGTSIQEVNDIVKNEIQQAAVSLLEDRLKQTSDATSKNHLLHMIAYVQSYIESTKRNKRNDCSTKQKKQHQEEQIASFINLVQSKRQEGVPDEEIALFFRQLEMPEQNITMLLRRAKVIFLDVDGVLSCSPGSQLEKKPLKQLERVCKVTGAMVVLTSEWRKHEHLKLKLIRSLAALKIQIIGSTPIIDVKGSTGIESRPAEIALWLKSVQIKIDTFVIIDDRLVIEEMGGEKFKEKFVNTKFATGLTKEKADECIDILTTV